MIKLVTFLIFLLTSLIAKFEVKPEVVEKKRDIKIQNLHQKINHPLLFQFNKKKVDEK
ncbi:hypothetical protein ACFPVY_13150 [Flavobacterium qiangtangense]|uniref:Uncharacterized protein n=1 Tax=Flavobacterium qiangtangense TaxID=1442595 RepID=A0ABW1PS15_9FLAO